MKIGLASRSLKEVDFSNCDDFFECPDCGYFGGTMLHGNSAFINALVQRKCNKNIKTGKPEKLMQDLKPAEVLLKLENPLLVVDLQKPV